MCGRSRCTLRIDDFPRACHLNACPLRSLHMDRFQPSYNVSPGRYLPVVRREDGSDGDAAVLHCMKWGLIPSFTKKSDKPDHYRMFNARSESVREKASFCRLLPNNRCLVAMEGFYEWKKDGHKKQPYYVHFKDGRPLVFAALYDSWKNSEGEILYSFTIMTTSSSSALEWLHDRMPVILGDKESTDTWLMGSSASKFDTVLKPYEKADLAWYAVTSAMGKPSFDGPECIKEIKLKTEETKPISKFFTKKGRQESSIPQAGGSTKLKEEEAETPDEAPAHHPFHTFGGNDESKPNVTSSSYPAVKRDYEEFSAETEMKPSSCGKADELETSSQLRKKANFGAADDKQPTLFSYYARR
ncbi:uncharacterized protein LOC127787175 [Diospyros lotus]|uniref:uncharacterized protein LOC127787175 n=1 Tax=Diospyros lotus TaxID=55363 RepID=UPI00225BAE55|nr:uncharacterized protein LOC127787175 [Diospyros lotus]